MSSLWRRNRFFAFLLLAFSFRLAYGLCAIFQDPDSIQTYLLGLKFYTTHQWPYFGPDVVWGEIQIPGALQGLLVGLPLYVLHLPEAPYVLLNILSFLSLCLLAWYCCKRLPDQPRWFIWIWLLTSPWTLNLSTHIYNPSYLLAPSILFFVSFLELWPATTKHLIDARLAYALIGFSIFWSMQIHLSWVLLLPYTVFVFYFAGRRGFQRLFRSLLWFVIGAAAPVAVLAPTYLKYGWNQGSGGTRSAVIFNSDNVGSIAGIVKRSLAFATFDITSFIGGHTASRVAFLSAEKWLVPFVAFLLVASVAQALALIIFWFKKNSDYAEWKAIKYLAVVNVGLIYVGFLFSLKPPQSNHLYITFPIMMIYSLYCWDPLLKKPGWRRFAKIFLCCGIIFHIGLAAYNFPRTSLYTMRARVQSAIDNKDYRILAERRPNTLY